MKSRLAFCLLFLIPIILLSCFSYTRFWNSIEDGDIITLEKMFKNGVDINRRDGYTGDTPLIRASAFGEMDVVKYLLKIGADVNMYNMVGESALLWAVWNGNLSIADTLLAYGADINFKQDRNVNLFIKIMNRYQIDIEKIRIAKEDSLKKTLKVNGSEKKKSIILDYRKESLPYQFKLKKSFIYLINHNALTDENKNCAQLFFFWSVPRPYCFNGFLNALYSNESDQYIVFDSDTTGLMIRADYDYKVLSQKLKNLGVDINMNYNLNEKINKFMIGNFGYNLERYSETLNNWKQNLQEAYYYNETALMRAAEMHMIHSAYLLLKLGADPNVVDNLGRNVLHYSILNAKTDFIRYLIDNYNINIYSVDNNGNNCLHFACYPLFAIQRIKDIHLEILEKKVHKDARIERLLKEEMQKQSKNKIINEITETIDLILSLGIDINSKNNEGMTPLMIAVQSNFESIVEMLLIKGADKNIRNNNNQTAFEIAQSLKIVNEEIIFLLSE